MSEKKIVIKSSKKIALFSTFTALLSVVLSIIVVFEHGKLKDLENRLSSVETGNNHLRIKKSIDEYINTIHTNSKWADGIESRLKPFIRDLVYTSIKNLKNLCGDSTSKFQGTSDRIDDESPPAGACCERLAAPAIEGPIFEQITAKYHHDILLPCKAAVGYPTPLVEWNSTVDDIFVHSKSGMYIPLVKAHHEGAYQCTISNIFGTSSKLIDLKVRGNITVNVTIPTKAFTDGHHEKAKLVCDFTGIPIPSITWRHIGLDGTNATVTNNVVTTNQSSVLTFNDLVFLHSGVYICTASNRYESVSSFGILEVRAIPYRVSPHFSNSSVIKGKDLTLDCTVVSNPIATIKWKLPEISGHTPFNVFDNGDGSITIRDAQQINEGDYICLASNSYGTVNATSSVVVIEPVRVQIAEPRHAIGSENYIAMDCRADGDPMPTIKWDKLGTVLDKSESRYIFLKNGDFIMSAVTKATQDKDSGVYSCTASNNHSNNTAYGIVYFDHGVVNCNAKFEDWSMKIGLAHGVKCPSDCRFKPGEVYGSGPYSTNSPVCKSAIHNGVLQDGNKLVFWYNTLGSNADFQGTLKNGITSHTSGPLFEAAEILGKSTSLYPASNSSSHSIIG